MTTRRTSTCFFSENVDNTTHNHITNQVNHHHQNDNGGDLLDGVHHSVATEEEVEQLKSALTSLPFGKGHVVSQQKINQFINKPAEERKTMIAAFENMAKMLPKEELLLSKEHEWKKEIIQREDDLQSGILAAQQLVVTADKWLQNDQSDLALSYYEMALNKIQTTLEQNGKGNDFDGTTIYIRESLTQLYYQKGDVQKATNHILDAIVSVNVAIKSVKEGDPSVLYHEISRLLIKASKFKELSDDIKGALSMVYLALQYLEELYGKKSSHIEFGNVYLRLAHLHKLIGEDRKSDIWRIQYSSIVSLNKSHDD